MHIKGKLNLEEMKYFMFSLGVAFLLGLVIYGVFALLNLISWIIAWVVISVILTPALFWIFRYLDGKITIDDHEDEDLSSIQREYDW